MSALLDLDRLRRAVADELEGRGIGTAPFIEEIRLGRRDDGPFMIGAIAWAKHLGMVGDAVE